MKMELKSAKKSCIRIFVYCVLFTAFMIGSDQNAIFAQEMHSSNSSPVYAGGLNALKEFIYSNLRSPDEAGKSGISGIVEVKFMINCEGKVENVMVMKGISPECDAEALRVTSLMSGWTPGIRQGKPVKTLVCIPIEFRGDNQSYPATVTGKINEKTSGLPLEGIFIIVKGTNIGSVSGPDGSYRLDIPSEARYLEYFGVGYSFREVEIAANSIINIELDPEYIILDFHSDDN
jgi:TonB family protein